MTTIRQLQLSDLAEDADLLADLDALTDCLKKQLREPGLTLQDTVELLALLPTPPQIQFQFPLPLKECDAVQ